MVGQSGQWVVGGDPGRGSRVGDAEMGQEAPESQGTEI